MHYRAIRVAFKDTKQQKSRQLLDKISGRATPAQRVKNTVAYLQQ